MSKFTRCYKKCSEDLAGMKVDQVAIGSCTNSGYEDLMKAASILKGKKIAHNVSFVVSPGSQTSFNEIN